MRDTVDNYRSDPGFASYGRIIFSADTQAFTLGFCIAPFQGKTARRKLFGRLKGFAILFSVKTNQRKNPYEKNDDSPDALNSNHIECR